MRNRLVRPIHYAAVWFVLMLGLPAAGLYAGQWQDGELRLKYPRAPKSLDADPASAGVLLVDFDFKGLVMKLQGLDGAALAKSDGDALRRAAPLKGRLILFDALESGTYALQLIKISNGNGRLLLPIEPTPELTVTVAPGVIHYLGAVEVSKPVGFEPYAFRRNYDATRELKALSEFKAKYATGRWGGLAEERLQSLRSGANPQGPPR